MRSFAAIATFAALAFSAVTSALPAGVTDLTGGLGNAASVLEVLSPVLAATQLDTGSQTNQANENGGLNLPRGDTHTGLGDILAEVNIKVGTSIKELTDGVTGHVEAEVVLALAVRVLAEVVVILKVAVDDITVLLRGDLALVLTLRGAVCDGGVIAGLLATLIKVILLAVALVLRICAALDVSVVLKLVLEIAALLAVIIHLVLKVVLDLVIILGPLLQVVAHLCLDLQLKALIDIFHF